MSEETNLILHNDQENLGEIVIAPEVLEIIIGIAASKVEGVYGMRGNFSANVTELLGGSVKRKGVYLKIEEDGLKVELYCYLNYGVSVPKVALNMQEKVKEQVLYMTDLELQEVNIHVMGIIPEKSVKPDLNDIIGMEQLDD